MRVINIEGIDAVGKETVSKELEKVLQEKGFRVKRISFPNYDGAIGKAIKGILMNEKIPAPSLDPKLFGPFYTMDRLSYFKCNIDDLINNYDYIIMDRSFYSNLMYQAAKYYISEKQKMHPPEFIDIEHDIDKYGMPIATIKKITNWISENYPWEIIETGLERCDTMFTFVLSMSEDDSKKQLNNRNEIDTNEANRYYLEGCKEFVSKLLDYKYKYNIMKVIESFSIENGLLKKHIAPRYIYNAIYYYLGNVEQVEVTHVDNPDDIPVATAETVGKIIEMMYNNDMFDDKGDDTNGET